jgi:hypothetical protein
MKSQKLVLSSERANAKYIIKDCCERIIIIGFVSAIIANSIHNSNHKRALESQNQYRSEPQQQQKQST